MDKQWAQIIAPSSPPADQAGIWGWVVLFFLIVLIALVYRHRPRVAMRRRLRDLQQQLANERIDEKSAGFIIADCLRRAYGTTRLDRLDFAGQQSQWQQFLLRLQQQQYQPVQPARTELQSLLQEARQWLRQ